MTGYRQKDTEGRAHTIGYNDIIQLLSWNLRSHLISGSALEIVTQKTGEALGDR